MVVIQVFCFSGLLESGIVSLLVPLDQKILDLFVIRIYFTFPFG